MLTLFRNGGFPMYFIVLFGFVALAAAAHYAARPDKRHEGFVEWMSRATLWSILVGFASDFASTFYYCTSVTDADTRARNAMEGIAESMSPGILGFALLSLVALLAAVGRRRLDARTA